MRPQSLTLIDSTFVQQNAHVYVTSIIYIAFIAVYCSILETILEMTTLT